jgi:hypothetical protein
MGTIFKITASGTLTTLHAFDNTDGSIPNALIQDTLRGFCVPSFPLDQRLLTAIIELIENSVTPK